jgi:hypothetical protein
MPRLTISLAPQTNASSSCTATTLHLTDVIRKVPFRPLVRAAKPLHTRHSTAVTTTSSVATTITAHALFTPSSLLKRVSQTEPPANTPHYGVSHTHWSALGSVTLFER